MILYDFQMFQFRYHINTHMRMSIIMHHMKIMPSIMHVNLLMIMPMVQMMHFIIIFLVICI